MGSRVLALSIAEVPEGRQRTPFLVRNQSTPSFPPELKLYVGCWMRRPNCSDNLIGPRYYPGDYELASIERPAFVYLHRGDAGCKY
jgi:hypothetical protein